VAFAHLLPPKGGRGLLLCKSKDFGLRHFAVKVEMDWFLERAPLVGLEKKDPILG